MSAPGAVSTQNYTHFHVTQEIWNQAWHSNDGFSMKSLCAKVACIVFPILLSVAIVEGIVWAVRSVFKIPSDPKSIPLNSQSVKQITEVIQEPKRAEEINKVTQQQEERIEPVQIDAPVALPTATVKVEEIDDTVGITNILTVALPAGSSLSDIETNSHDPINQRPPASAYHALESAYFGAGNFNVYASDILKKDSDELAAYQRQMISLGTGDYFNAVKKDPSLKDGADLENIKIKDPTFLRRNKLYFGPTNKDPKAVDERTRAIVEHLFIPQEEPESYVPRNIAQIALLKSGNDQTISVVCVANQAIVFNSHKNEITMTIGKEATQAYLTEMLAPFAKMEGGIDQNPFSYALGQYDRTRNDADEPGTQPQVNETVAVEKPNDIVINPHIITVALPAGSSLSDIEINMYEPKNERPPASVYHALRAIYFLAPDFTVHANRIQEEMIDRITQFQREAIVFGTGDYVYAVKKDPSLKDGADLESIRIKDPNYLLKHQFYFEPTNVEPKSVVEQAQAIVEHLFIPREDPEFLKARKITQIALLKSGNDQTTSVVCATNRAIFFNSHKNEITLTVGKKATQAHLIKILGGSMRREYALGRYDTTVK